MAAERKGKKLRRCTKLASMYKVQFGITDNNKQKKLGRHLRHFPEDLQAIKLYDEKYPLRGGSSGHLANITARAKQRTAPRRRTRKAPVLGGSGAQAVDAGPVVGEVAPQS
jgi:hypothetical protein